MTLAATPLPRPVPPRLRWLPGVRFESAPVPAGDLEPRMDVAGFVGFAATGPVDVPVPIDDPTRLLDVFGADTALLTDAATGAVERAHLVPTVRAYLRNGGRRCWVVRVTDRQPGPPYGSLAARAEFRLPSLMGGDDSAPVRLRARSVGSWADGLRVSASTVDDPLDLAAAGVDPDRDPPVRCTLRTAPPGVGSLLRLSCSDGDVLCFVHRVDGSAVEAGDAVWLVDGSLRPLAAACDPVRAAVVTLQLRARAVGGAVWTLDRLGLHHRHPRWIGDLPIDEDLYRPEDAYELPGPSAPRPALWSAVATPRFPLAGPVGTRLCYPTGPGVPVAPEAAEGTPLQRDGLDVDHPADTVLDPTLAGLSPAVLAGTADHLRWTAAVPRPLLGAHALLAVDEVTLVATPDAAHRPWTEAPAPAAPAPPVAEPEPIDTGEPDVPGPFRDCDPPPAALESPAAPDGSGSAGRRVVLTWPPVPGADGYLVQESADPAGWLGAAELRTGPAPALELERDPGARFYRVRAVAGSPERTGPWSAGTTVVVAGSPAWRLAGPPTGIDAALVAAHRGLVALCAARGDLLALLSLPADARDPEVVRHAAALRAGRDDRTLSFGALHHPWPVLAAAEGGGSVRPVPPDAVVAGTAAVCARRRGAWVAPAVEGFADIVALTPAADPQVLLDARVNALRQEPRGFCALGADTLSADPDLGEIGTRRLLSLLRRLVVRVGVEVVFAPDDAVLRRRLRALVDGVLAGLLARGAFAGPTPAESYRVSIAPAGTGPEGQLVVEIRVAPSTPLRFLTVRLVRAGDGGVRVEEPVGGGSR